MDSAIATWREEPAYRRYPQFRNSVETARDRMEALLAEEQDNPAKAVLHWRKVLERMSDSPRHQLIFENESCARALVQLGGYAAALDHIESVLAINPRLMRSLVLAVQAHYGIGQQREAQKYLQQLGEALRFADPDYPVRADYVELKERLN
jgi:uncharacterized protein HemY